MLLLSIDGTDRRADGHSFYDAYRVLCGPRDKTKATELPDRPLLLATFPSRAFSVSAPSTWNSLPAHIRSIDTLSTLNAT